MNVQPAAPNKIFYAEKQEVKKKNYSIEVTRPGQRQDKEEPSFRYQAPDPGGNSSNKSVSTTNGTDANHVPIKQLSHKAWNKDNMDKS
jgi:hypothetical protein